MMEYTAARRYIEETTVYGSVLGLDSIRELLRRLGSPQESLKFVHIAGTNGKGSVLSYLGSILQESGYRIGTYTSPALFDFREIIRVNGEMIREEAFARHTEALRQAALSMANDGLPHPTRFELETTLAFLYFKDQCCDLVLLETGLGGQEDATNVVTQTILALFTSISMDHMSFLGDTRSKITRVKAGIMKPGAAAISAWQDPEVLETLRAEAHERKIELQVVAEEWVKDRREGYRKQSFTYEDGTVRLLNLTISMAGVHQFQNASLAVRAALWLSTHGYPLSEEQIREGLKKAGWLGRLTEIGQEPLFLIDGAHNEHAALQLQRSLKTYFPNQKMIFLVGIFRDKEYNKILEITAPLARCIIAVNMIENTRLLTAAELKAAADHYHRDVRISEDVRDSVRQALTEAQEDEVIVAFGSLSFLDELSRAYQAVRKDEYHGSR